MSESLGDIIRNSMADAGMEPVEFDQPLKSVHALYKLTKRIEPEHLVERHAAVGWGLGNLMDHFGKTLFDIKSFTLSNTKNAVEIEAVINLSGLTFEDDHEAWLDKMADYFTGTDIKQSGWFWRARYYHWDTWERLTSVQGFTQMQGDGIATGGLDDKL